MEVVMYIFYKAIKFFIKKTVKNSAAQSRIPKQKKFQSQFRSQPRSIESKTPKDIVEICHSLTPEEKKELCYLFLIDEFDLCDTLKNWEMFSKMKQIDVNYLMSVLKIKKNKQKSKSNSKSNSNVSEIINEIYTTFKPLVSHDTFLKLVDEKSNIKDKSLWFCTLLYKIIRPDNFPQKSEMKISEEMYNEYLLILQKEKDENIKIFFNDDVRFEYLKSQEILRLREALEAKFCSCIGKFVFQNKLSKVISYDKLSNYEPISLCARSIFMNRKTLPNRETKFILPFDEKIIQKCHKSVTQELKI